MFQRLISKHSLAFNYQFEANDRVANLCFLVKFTAPLNVKVNFICLDNFSEHTLPKRLIIEEKVQWTV